MAFELWLALQGPVYDYLQLKTDEWNRSHCECQVEIKNFVSNQGYGQPADFALSKPDDEQPALVLAPEFMTSKMVQGITQKKVLPLSQILDQSELATINTLVKRTFGDINGNTLSLPFNPACGILYTNKEMLQKIGKSPDFVPKSLEELEETSRELIEKNICPHGYTTAWPAAYLVEVPAAQQDLPLALPENGFEGYGDYQLNSPWLIAHFKTLRREQAQKIYLYAGKDNGAKKPFIEGKVAFFMQGSSHYKSLQTEAKFHIGCGPIPTLTLKQKVKYAFPLGGSSLWVINSKQTQNAKKCLAAYLTFLASKDVQHRLHEETASVPITDPPTPNQSLHKAVLEQTVLAPLGQYSFGIHMPNYADARRDLFDLIETLLAPTTSDDDLSSLLASFDSKHRLDPSTYNSVKNDHAL